MQCAPREYAQTIHAEPNTSQAPTFAVITTELLLPVVQRTITVLQERIIHLNPALQHLYTQAANQKQQQIPVQYAAIAQEGPIPAIM